MDFSDRTRCLARDEFSALWERSCGGEPPFEPEFELDPELSSFEVVSRNGIPVFRGPSAVEQLYGVYDFAEKFLGYCFFEPGRDRLDKLGAGPRLPEGVLIPARKPLLKRRGFIQEFPFDADSPALFDWMAKNKLNYLLTWMKFYDALDASLKEELGVRGIEIESGHHNFNYWIPGRRYSRTNPDFFAEINGKRITSSDGKAELLLSEQICTTNPALRREIVKNMVAYCRANPEIKTLSLVPNDGFGWCECGECSKFYDKNSRGDLYSVSEHVYKANRIYHDMVSDVITMLRRELPDVNVTFCAYINYCAPSPGFKLEKNMAVHMAPYWRCINHRIDDPACEVNSHYARDIRAWCSAKDGGEVNIYEYYMGVNLYISLPMVHHIDIFAEARWYHRQGVDGVLTQFHIPHWTVYGLNYYLMAKALRGESELEAVGFAMKRLFGADAPKAEKFYAAVKNLLFALGGCHIPYPYSLLSRTRLEQYEKLHRQALELSSDDPFRRELSVWTEYMVRFKKLFDDYHAGRAGVPEIEAFRDWIHLHRDTRVFVHPKVDMLLNAWRDAVLAGRPWLHFNIGWEDEYIRKHEQRRVKHV